MTIGRVCRGCLKARPRVVTDGGWSGDTGTHRRTGMRLLACEWTESQVLAQARPSPGLRTVCQGCVGQVN